MSSVTMLATKKKNLAADLHHNKNLNLFSDGYTQPSDPYADVDPSGYYGSITSGHANVPYKRETAGQSP